MCDKKRMITQNIQNFLGFDAFYCDAAQFSSIKQMFSQKCRWITALLIIWWANIFLFTQAQLDEYIRRLEEAERNIRTAEAKIEERDQRIIEVERLLDCMGTVKEMLL